MHPHYNPPSRLLQGLQQPQKLIDNLFYDFTKKNSTGNILTSISDHLTQYLLICNQTELSLNNNKKETLKIRKFNKKYFLEEFRNIGWDNYLKTYKKDTDLSLELFLRKTNFFEAVQICQTTDSTHRTILHQKFKNYRNQTVTLNHLWKENYSKHTLKPIKKTRKEYGMV